MQTYWNLQPDGCKDKDDCKTAEQCYEACEAHVAADPTLHPLVAINFADGRQSNAISGNAPYPENIVGRCLCQSSCTVHDDYHCSGQWYHNVYQSTVLLKREYPYTVNGRDQFFVGGNGQHYFGRISPSREEITTGCDINWSEFDFSIVHNPEYETEDERERREEYEAEDSE